MLSIIEAYKIFLEKHPNMPNNNVRVSNDYYIFGDSTIDFSRTITFGVSSYAVDKRTGAIEEIGFGFLEKILNDIDKGKETWTEVPLEEYNKELGLTVPKCSEY